MTHLHLHTENGSRLDAIATSSQYAKKAKELGHKSLGLSDHGKCSNFFNHQKACEEEGIKPIFGVEVYLTEKLTTLEIKKDKEKRIRTKNNHLVLIAKNEAGYKNLLKLNYLSHKDKEHFYYTNRNTFKEVFQNKKGLIATSACIAGPIAQKLILEGEEKAEEMFLRFENEFGEDFYPEVHINEIEEQKAVNKFILNMCDKYGKTPIIGGDVHYLNKGDDIYQTLSIAIRDKKTIDTLSDFIESKNLFYHDEKDYYEFNKLWGYNYEESEIKKWLEESDKIADKCNYKIPKRNKTFLPKLSEDDDALLVEKVIEASKEMYKVEDYSKINKEIRARISKELELIIRKGFSSYILILEDVMSFVRKDYKLWAGNGRGSGAGSIVNFLLKITTVNPLDYGLIFERFLSDSRSPDMVVNYFEEVE